MAYLHRPLPRLVLRIRPLPNSKGYQLIYHKRGMIEDILRFEDKTLEILHCRYIIRSFPRRFWTKKERPPRMPPHSDDN